ncbi:SEC-C domain-containing protein [Xanthomonas campestris]|uniref:SEC-C domain-containing protein n=2 Tax=Xanthomonas TaxID=338 RepID=UPI0009BD45C6|nr:SEC-C domain-containing protein [Xanthomonas campestris]MCC5091261.1 SEC-C domain-containing protein [Xanthomonas campestris]MCF8838433.1 SEC-C domain-containing protein [Xanthomonas campestris pv. campestris]MCF8865805.1 SEC-C domain-containing protein [Xanthomonas campestris pv. campestris]MDO0840190.1 SEC-C domain-containing protein [Xanthomonas campestris pv. campestris]MDO0882935.1 SEC-C domain-containing protein [Xanthomonas campestris pv. campestris]
MSVVTTTPPEITRAVRRLADSVVRGAQPVYLSVHPEADAIVHECFPNVQAKIARDGGQMLCGWQLWEWPHVLVEAEFHAVWISPAGEMIDITPKPEGEARILFVPDPRRRYKGLAIDNVRMPLRDDLLIKHFIQMSEAIVRVMNRGERASQYGHVSVPVDEIQPLLQARDFLGQSLGAGLREHAPCLCGSGSKYKRCHGAQLEAFFRR